MFFLYTILSIRWLCANHKADMLNLYAFNFGIRKSYERQSNAFDQSITIAPNNFPFSVPEFHFSSIYTRRCWALKPFLNHHWWLEKKFQNILAFVWTWSTHTLWKCLHFFSPFYGRVLYLPFFSSDGYKEVLIQLLRFKKI